MRHKLDLRGNAIDSLNEGLRRFVEARDEDERAFKFAVLHLAHFLELLLKHAVVRRHPLLVYEKPASRNLHKERTIGLWDAVQTLRNAGVEFDQDLIVDLEWLKRVRNDIEHFEFDMDIRDVRASLGRILRATDQFLLSAGLEPLSSLIETDSAKVLDELLDEYKERLANAKADARKESEEAEYRCELTGCTYCGGSAVAVRRSAVIHCYFCEEEEPLRQCVICDQTYRDHETSVWNDEHEETDYACEYCESRILGRD